MTSYIGDVLYITSSKISLRLYVILTSLVPRLHLQRFGRWSLGTILTLALLRLLTAPAPRTYCRLDFHHATVSRGHGVSPSERSNAHLSVALRGSREEGSIWKYIRDQKTDAYGLQRADIVRVLSVALSYV